ncbi:MAG TPA: hypothetical protein VFJ29_01655 [Candidatus Kapabacteria bacterium]|nr:hypothetical protein [Candidatus Kapabacteria bacterium]
MNQKKRIYFLAILFFPALLFLSCDAFQEIIHETVPPPDQLTSSGVVKLFKQAADSSDVDRAVGFMCSPKGVSLTALERYNMDDEMVRYLDRIHGRYMRIWSAKGSRVAGDSIVTVDAEFGWLFSWNFITHQIGDKWYISEIQEETK